MTNSKEFVTEQERVTENPFRHSRRSAHREAQTQELLDLQRLAGNASVSGYLSDQHESRVDLPIQRAVGTAEPAQAPAKEKGGASKIKEVASELAEETLKGIATGVVEDEIPFVAVINKTIELSSAFGDGVVEGIMKARDELNYDKDIATAMSDSGEGLSDKAVEAIQHVRHWQANAVAKLDDVLLSGLKFALEHAVEMAGDWLAGKIADKALEKLGHAVSKFVRVRFSSSEFAHGAEGELSEAAHEAYKAIREAFADAVGSKVFESTGEGVKTEFEAKKKLTEAGVMSGRMQEGEKTPSDAGERQDALAQAVEFYAKVHMSIDDVINDVDEKVEQVFVNRPNLRGSSIAKSHDELKTSLDELSKLVESHNSLGWNKYTLSGIKQTGELKEQIRAKANVVSAKFNSLETSLDLTDNNDVKFGSDRAAVERVVTNL